MTYRVRRKFTSHTFKVNDQYCKVFLDPWQEYQPGYWLWNVGFAVSKSTHQLNDWYRKRQNKRRYSLDAQLSGHQGMKTIIEGFKHVLEMRWHIEPGDAIVLDCTSKEPERQFKAWSRWHRYHPEWSINFERKEFYWHRPPYPNDPLREDYLISGCIPKDPLANTSEARYYDCFRIHPKVPYTDLSMEQIDHQ